MEDSIASKYRIARGREIALKAQAENRSLSVEEVKEVEQLIREVNEDRESKRILEARKYGITPDEMETREIQAAIRKASIGGVASGDGTGLFHAIKEAGWDRKTKSAVTVPSEIALAGKTGSFDGDVADDAFNPAVRRDGPALGADQRFAYPALRTENVGSEITTVPGFRQEARFFDSDGAWSEGSWSDGDRPIDDTSSKPEISTEAEVYAVSLKQFAYVQTGTPNILLANPTFRGYCDTDLRLAYSETVDLHCLTAIADASPDDVSGSNLLEAILAAAADIAGDGYTADLLLLSPADALTLALLKQPIDQEYITSDVFGLLNGLERRVCKGLSAPIVMNKSAAGVLYLSPTLFATFEENAGATNSSTLRLESNGAFNVERVSAIRTVSVTSA